MKIYLVILFSLILFGCKTNQNISSISDRVSNVSNKVVSLVKSEKTVKPLKNFY